MHSQGAGARARRLDGAPRRRGYRSASRRFRHRCGYFIGKPGLLYRKHPDQITSQAEWTEPTEWNARMRLIEARALALQDVWGQR
jgi:hypothetical protein